MDYFLTFFITAAIGAVGVAFAYGKRELADLPELAEVKKDYPIINTMLYFLKVGTDDATLLGMVAKAAYTLYVGEYKYDEEEAVDRVKAIVAHFDKSKFLDTINVDLDNLDTSAVEQGKRIARELLGAAV